MDQNDRPGARTPPRSAAGGQTHLTERGKREAEERRQRQAQALRANLARRKAQDRVRTDPTPAGDNPPEALENKD